MPKPLHPPTEVGDMTLLKTEIFKKKQQWHKMTPLTDEANIHYDFFPENSDDLTNI